MSPCVAAHIMLRRTIHTRVFTGVAPVYDRGLSSLAACICIFIFIANERHGTFVLCLRIIDGCPFAFASDKNSCLLISFILRVSLTHRENIVRMKIAE